MNLLAIGIQLAFINTLGRLVFNLSEFPDWAQIEGNSTAQFGLNVSPSASGLL